MKVDLSKEILNIDGKPIAVEEGKSKNLTTGDVLMTCLNTPLKGDDEESGDVRLSKWKLLQGIFRNSKGSLDIDSEEISMLKERVRKVYPSPVIYGNIIEQFGDKK